MTKCATKLSGQLASGGGILAWLFFIYVMTAGLASAQNYTPPGNFSSGMAPGQAPDPATQAPGQSRPSNAAPAGGGYMVEGRPANRQMFEAASVMQDAIALLNQNRTEEALPKLQQAIELAPDMALAHNNYAIGLGKLGRSDEAIAEFQKTIALDPNLPYAWISLAGLFQSQGRIDDALSAYHELLKRFPTHPEAAKVTAIITGLEKVKASLPPTMPGASQTDYLAEVTTQSGLHRWPADKMPIKVFIQPGVGVPGFKPEYDAILRECFSDWEKAGNGLLSFAYVDDAQKADLECSWSDDPHTLANQAEAGETRLSTSVRTLAIVHGRIRLLTVPLVQALPVTDNRLRTTILHEIGHALGLTGHTQNPNDIMFFSAHITDNRFELTPRDVNTLVRLYTDSPGK